METLYRHYIQALQLEVGVFAERNRGLFIVKRPMAVPEAAQVHDPLGEEDEAAPTRLVNLDDTLRPGADDAQTMAAEWRIAPLKKQSGYPPFNRIVVGRSRVCDVVIPFLTVSKVHCHIHVEAHLPTQISDQRSANGTFVNGTQLPPLQPVSIGVGDSIRLGEVELDVIDADVLYALLRSM